MIIKNLTYKDIITNINMNIPKSIYYLKGKNGSGKSTLFDCICNINTDYTGKITGNENVVYLNQNLYFSYRLKSSDFVNFICTLENIKDYKNKYNNYIKEYNYDSKYNSIKNKEVGKLSGGERALLYFITITFIERDWYILDEPFAGVDEEGKECMSKIINRLATQNKGIIMTTHEAETLKQIKPLTTLTLEQGQVPIIQAEKKNATCSEH